jgi:Ca2+-binding EF-hand superfamily protein
MSADADGDGMISAEEYRMAARGAYQQSMESGDGAAGAGTEVWMGSTDAAGAAEMSEEQAGARASMHFRSFDEDGDGQVSREEWTGVSDDENAGAGAQGAYFDSVDEDMDGQWTLEEFSAARGSAYDNAMSAAEAEGTDTSAGVPAYTYRFYLN